MTTCVACGPGNRSICEYMYRLSSRQSINSSSPGRWVQRCDAGQYQPGHGGLHCNPCSDLGDSYYQDQKGQLHAMNAQTPMSVQTGTCQAASPVMIYWILHMCLLMLEIATTAMDAQLVRPSLRKDLTCVCSVGFARLHPKLVLIRTPSRASVGIQNVHHVRHVLRKIQRCWQVFNWRVDLR